MAPDKVRTFTFSANTSMPSARAASSFSRMATRRAPKRLRVSCQAISKETTQSASAM